MSEALALIAARGGSKRIPKKNIRDFLGSPIIRYPIEAAEKCGVFDDVMVSTDDREIAEIAQRFGAQVPFMRSQKTSTDFATTADVIEEVLTRYRESGKMFDYCCCIYPTAPFITPERLKQGLDILKDKDADTVIPVVQFSYPIFRALKIENGRLCMIWPENLDKRSQDLPSAYHDAGQFYWLNVERFMKQKKLFTANSFPIEIPESEVQDIDNFEDWDLAQIKFKALQAKLGSKA